MKISNKIQLTIACITAVGFGAFAMLWILGFICGAGACLM